MEFLIKVSNIRVTNILYYHTVTYLPVVWSFPGLGDSPRPDSGPERQQVHWNVSLQRHHHVCPRSWHHGQSLSLSASFYPPFQAVLDEQKNASFTIISIFIVFCTTTTLCLVFVPKVSLTCLVVVKMKYCHRQKRTIFLCYDE